MPTKLSADDSVQLFPSEQPRYPELASALTLTWGHTRSAFARLRSRWFEAVALAEARKDDDEARPLLANQRKAMDEAIEAFLREMAGSQRNAEGFAAVEDDGLIQQAEWLAHSVGVHRARQLLPGAPNPALTAGQRRRLMEDAFSRLSADGTLRFETRLGEIRDAMVGGFNRGDNPLAIARRLSQDLDGYEAGRLRTIIRTEMGISAIGASRGLYESAGVRQVEVIGDSTTDALCTAHIGNVYPVTQTESLPVYHPSCFCDIVPVTD